MRFLRSLFCLLCVSIFLHPVHASESAVLLSPLRMILEGRERVATLRIVNPNERTVTYRIEANVLEQDAAGNLQESENPDAHAALLRMIRFSPRQVRLEPGAMQAVRIMVRKPADLKAGEYRVHLKVSPLPGPEPVLSPSGERANDTRIDIRFLVSTSVPLIIRHGETEVFPDAQDPHPVTLPDGRDAIQIRMLARGNRSAYMDAFLFHGEKRIGELRGFAVYQPNGERQVRIPLTSPLPAPGASLRLALHDREKEGAPLIREVALTLAP